MKKSRLLRTGILIGVFVLLRVAFAAYDRWTGQLPGASVHLLLARINLLPGFQIHVYATGVPNARSLALGPDGTVFVGSRKAGRLYALLDHKAANKADEVITIARGLNNPNGVAFRDGALYVAEINRILRFDDMQVRLGNSPSPVGVNANFPSDPAHCRKFIRFSPDGWLYVPVGAPCNVCEPKDPRFATIKRMRRDGSDLQVFARGIRNSVGFDRLPRTNELWFTDNGRDMLGDDIPPDELNYAPRSGMNFGFPYCHGKNIPDPQFGPEHTCSDFIPPALELPAHAGALGMRFYTGTMFPPPIETKSSSQNTDHGIAAFRQATGSAWPNERETRP
jgi:glucose/arabinose dehydrogenase